MNELANGLLVLLKGAFKPQPEIVAGSIRQINLENRFSA
jgi:hypothetical protein